MEANLHKKQTRLDDHSDLADINSPKAQQYLMREIRNMVHKLKALDVSYLASTDFTDANTNAEIAAWLQDHLDQLRATLAEVLRQIESSEEELAA